MDRRTVRVAVVAALSIIALSAAAATLDTATTSGGGFGPSDAEGGALSDSEGGSPLGFDDRGDAPLFAGDKPIWSACFEFLRSLEFFVGLAIVIAALFVLLSIRRDPLYAGLLILGWGLPLSLVYLFLAQCPDGNGDETGLVRGEANNSSMPSGGGLFGDNTGHIPESPSIVMLLLLVVVLVVAAVVLVQSTGDDDQERPATVEDPEPEDDRIEAIGRVAGDAADRIDAQGDVENEVFRAWREMASLLTVDNPQATTPREFAAAATDAGMTRDDVDELTDLFESVRYGGVAPTDDREQRAVTALRNIESTYASAEDSGWSTDGGRR